MHTPKQVTGKENDLLTQIILSSSAIINRQKKVLESSDLSLQQFQILKALKSLKGKPASINALGEYMFDKMSNTSRLVDKLKAKKYVKRAHSQADRRKVEVVLTKEGKVVLQKADRAMNRLEKSILKELSSRDQSGLTKILNKLNM
jgi:DNA-binding MarR family transcriptional regulator